MGTNKKVLYLVRYSEDYNFSIKNKIDGQLLALKELGYSVDYLVCNYDGFWLIRYNGEKHLMKRIQTNNFEKYWHSWLYPKLYGVAVSTIKKFHYDYIYARSSPLFYKSYLFFKKAKKKCSKIIVEIPTNDVKVPSREGLVKKLYGFYSRFLNKKCSRYVDLYVVIGNNMSCYLNRPAINIQNGVCVDNYPISIHQSCGDDKIHFLALASMCKWHGYDRLLRGLVNYDDRDNVVIDFVGDEGDGSLANWTSLANDLGLSSNVVFHGKKYGKDLDTIISKMDVGVGTLAFYRAGIYCSSVLKNREYMARGIPFIYSSRDDVLAGCEYCFEVENSETPIDFHSVIAFLNNVHKISNYQNKMRDFAKKNMSWEKQFEKVFIKLDELEV